MVVCSEMHSAAKDSSAAARRGMPPHSLRAALADLMLLMSAVLQVIG